MENQAVDAINLVQNNAYDLSIFSLTSINLYFPKDF